MNQRQRNKFHKAIQSLDSLLKELNAGCETWELRYNAATCKFNLSKMNFPEYNFEAKEQDENYFPWFYVGE